MYMMKLSLLRYLSSLGVFGESTNTLFDMLHDLKYDEQRIKYVKKKIIASCIRSSYYSVDETKTGTTRNF